MKLATLMAAALSASCLFAKTVYVDCKFDDYTGHDGSTPELAVETIQEGLQKTVSGDTIEVAPGVYKKGRTYDTHWWGPTRVWIGHKVYLHATQGPEVTIIEGEKDPDGTLGCGPAGLRAFISEGDDAAASVIEGFTIRGCRTGGPDEAYPKNQGSVIFSSTGGHDYREGPYFVGCTVEDCAGWVRAISYGGTFVRSMIRDCQGRPGQFFSYRSVFVNSVIYHNTVWNADQNGFSGIHLDCSKFFNCTFADNAVYDFYPTTPTYLYNNLYLATPVPEGGSKGYNSGNFADDVNKRAMIAPATGDFRLRDGATADVNVGDAAWLAPEVLVLPTNAPPFNVSPYVDFYGNAIPKTGAIAAGACQAKVAPVGGAVTLPSEMTSLCTNFTGRGGSYFYVMDKTATYRLYPNYGKSVKRVLNYAYYLYTNGVETVHAAVSSVFPLMDDSTVIIPPADTADKLMVQASRATDVIRYADPKAPEEGADGSYDHPYPSLQKALDESKKAHPYGYGFAVAKPGVYDKDVSTYSYNGYTGAKTRLLVASGDARITTEKGPEVTFLVGAPDPDTLSAEKNPGCGKGAVNAFTVLGQAQLQGFTVTGAYSGEGTDVNSPARGSFFTYGADMHVTDCIITNNHGSIAAIGRGRFCRCKMTGNYGGLKLIDGNSILSGCEIWDNTVPNTGYVVYGGTISIYNCSIADNGAWTAIGQAGDNNVYNTLLNHGGYKLFSTVMSHGCVYDGYQSYEGAGTYQVAAPCFVNETVGDLRAAATGPAKNAGVGAGGELASKKWIVYSQTDIHGNPITLNADGTAVAGADMNLAHGIYISATQGGIAVTGGKIGFNELTDETEITVTAAKGTRPVSALVVNGVTNDFETLPEHALVLTKDSGDTLVDPLYTTTWYCAPDGDDKAGGGFPAAPMTLQGALTAAVSGDTVKALAGTYDSGKMIQDGSYVASGTEYKYALHARALVKSGVTLESVDGRDATVIKGAAATVEDEKYGFAPDGAGLGADAIRCVYLEAGGNVKGFTLKDGHTRCRLADGKEAHSHIETSGGGVYAKGACDTTGWDNWGVVEDCIITNCVAYRGAGAYGGRYVKTVFCDNQCCYIGGAFENGKIYGSLVYGNHAYYPYIATHPGCYDLKHANQTTFFDHAILASGWTTMINCLCYKVSFDTSTPQAFNNVFSATSGVDTNNFPAASGNVVAPDTDLVYDADFRPVVGHNVAVDFGSIASAEAEPDFLSGPDVLGGQRVYNGTIDAGALEGDWRETYGNDLHKRYVTVTEASPDVTETASKALELTDGTAIGLKLKLAETAFDVAVKVSDGTLTLKVGEDDPVEYTADQTIRLTVPSTDTPVTFSYAGTGTAEIGKFTSKRGTCIILR